MSALISRSEDGSLIDNSVLFVENVSKTYPNGVNAIKDVSFILSEGEILGILGPNGAGKTTLVRIISGYFLPDSGQVRLLGKDVTKIPRGMLRDLIGVVQQDLSYEPYVSVRRNLYIYGELLGLKREEIEERAKYVMDLFHLDGSKKAKELSGGTKKRLQVAREFLKIRPVMVLDEPTVGLDPLAKRTLLNEIKQLKREGVSFLYTSHVLSEVEELCDKILVLHRGKVKFFGKISDFKKLHGTLKRISVFLKQPLDKLPLPLSDTEKVHSVKLRKNWLTVYLEDDPSTIVKVASILEPYAREILINEPSLEEIFIRVFGGENNV